MNNQEPFNLTETISTIVNGVTYQNFSKGFNMALQFLKAPDETRYIVKECGNLWSEHEEVECYKDGNYLRDCDYPTAYYDIYEIAEEGYEFTIKPAQTEDL